MTIQVFFILLLSLLCLILSFFLSKRTKQINTQIDKENKKLEKRNQQLNKLRESFERDLDDIQQNLNRVNETLKTREQEVESKDRVIQRKTNEIADLYKKAEETAAVDSRPDARADGDGKRVLGWRERLTVFDAQALEQVETDIAPTGVLEIVALHDVGPGFVGDIGVVLVHARADVVVGLDDANVGAARFRQASVHGIAVTGVRLVYDAYAPVPGSVFPEDLERIVGRPVVDGDDLDFGQRLRAYGVEACAQVFRHVVDGNQYGYDRACSLGHCFPYP